MHSRGQSARDSRYARRAETATTPFKRSSANAILAPAGDKAAMSASAASRSPSLLLDQYRKSR